MVLILLEALGALLLLVLIVWWTMFSGRKNGEPVDRERAPDETRWTGAENLTSNQKKDKARQKK
jgi:hypothetical protein